MADNDDGLGPKPEPQTQEPEHFPGGVDSIQDEERYGEIPDDPVIPDVNPETVSEVDELPEAVKESDPPNEGDDQPKQEAEPGSGSQEPGS